MSSSPSSSSVTPNPDMRAIQQKRTAEFCKEKLMNLVSEQQAKGGSQLVVAASDVGFDASGGVYTALKQLMAEEGLSIDRYTACSGSCDFGCSGRCGGPIKYSVWWY